MKYFNSIILILSLFSISHLYSVGSEEDLAALSRSDNLPPESLEGASDTYFEGYIQALIDVHYYEFQVVVIVKDRDVWLSNLPKSKLIASSIISFVKDVPGVKSVKVLEEVPEKDVSKMEKYALKPHVSGIWFPQSTELFQPIVANPRQVTYSAGYRIGDVVVGTRAIAVSFGDDFPIFRWLNVFWRGDLQIGIEACVWSVFNIDKHGPNYNGGTELVNSDYYVGIPISYALNNWSFRFCIYHLSSHLGDEFLVNHPAYVTNVTNKPNKPVRLNPSFEAIDFYMSYQPNDIFRFVLGPGIFLHSDRQFPMKTFYINYGAEARFLGLKMYYHRLYGTFFAGVFFRSCQYLHWDYDGTYVLGYEWSKLQGIGRKIRVFIEGHNGFSLEGQFMKDRTSYLSISMSYGF